MKGIVLMMGIFLLAPGWVHSQVMDDFNHGSENISRARCWQVKNVRRESWGINSNPSEKWMSVSPFLRTTNAYEIISPHIRFDGTGVIRFKHVLNETSSNPNLEIYLTDPSGGVVQTLLSHTYTSTAVLHDSISVQWSGTYQVRWEWSGSGGNTKVGIDDIHISGHYASDSSQSDKLGRCPLLPIPYDTACEGEISRSYQVYSAGGSNHYSWFLSDPSGASIDSSISGNNASVTVDWIIPGTYQLYAIGTTPANCIGDTMLMHVEVLPRPIFSLVADTVCYDEPRKITFAFTGNAPWTIEYTDGISTYTDTCYTSPCASTLPPANSGQPLNITNLQDGRGCVGDTSGLSPVMIPVLAKPSTGSIYHH